MPDAFLLAGVLGVFIIGYVFGWSAGRSSGKVDALETIHDVDVQDQTDGRGDEDA